MVDSEVIPGYMNYFINRIKTTTFASYFLAMFFIFSISLFLRIYIPYENVFVGDWVRFQINDPYYHMRLVENLVHNFPNLMPIDPYGYYPSGIEVTNAPFFDMLLGFCIWVLGFGSPSQELIEKVGAYFPAILGALVTIPVFFIGKEMFNNKIGLIAAALIAILPGEFLMRSLLGFTDHHVAETLFSTTTLMFLILAIKRSKQNEVSFNSLLVRDWKTLRKPLIYSLSTGIFLGFYLLSWTGGAIFVLIILVSLVLQYIIDHLRGKPTDYLYISSVPSLIVALLMVFPVSERYSYGNIQVASLIISICAVLGIGIISILFTRRGLHRVFYPLTLAALGGIGLALFYLINPSLLESIFDKIDVIRPTGDALTISEVKGYSLDNAWDNYGIAFYLALISLAAIAVIQISKREWTADKTLLFIWSVTMLVATFGQTRFEYYLSVNLALLMAYFSWMLWKWPLLIFRLNLYKDAIEIAETAQPAGIHKKAKQGKDKSSNKKQRIPTTNHLASRMAYTLISTIVIFLLIFNHSIGESISWASELRGATDDWHESLVWLKENSPDPFQDPDFYYAEYKDTKIFTPPESTFSVMNWSDYGYWVTYFAHQIPKSTPSKGKAGPPARFFTANSESLAIRLLGEYKSKYIIADYELTMGKFYAVLEWAGENQDEYFEYYTRELEGGSIEIIQLFYPKYYETMGSRLYNFGGEEWVPGNSTLVISYEEKQIEDMGTFLAKIKQTYGQSFDKASSEYFRNYFSDRENTRKVITEAANNGKAFNTYEDALSFIESNKSSEYRIVGRWQFSSPVPLEKLDHFKLIHKSPNTAVTRGDEELPFVQIFEYEP